MSGLFLRDECGATEPRMMTPDAIGRCVASALIEDWAMETAPRRQRRAAETPIERNARLQKERLKRAKKRARRLQPRGKRALQKNFSREQEFAQRRPL
ncbi:hypothetical protein GN958_ATG21598 [Phytophthora infestans]|uniref:Uncharacterized protein n=1 Tax=Phytophthora infestans TaxID=4787 RepID=A0A8S9TS10_PHYIN|nr:hypothetical protein GN958_ATG21598 [Phytophthora infestans]